MSKQSLFEDVEKALGRDDWETVRSLLGQAADDDDIDIKIYRGTILSLCPDLESYHEGVSILRDLAENGNGQAAHNLATALGSGVGASKETRSECAHFMQIAVDSGFEETVSNDPNWWKE